MITQQGKDPFVQLIQENKGIIFKICNSYCTNKNDRDDLAQEIVYHLWKSYSSFNRDFKFTTWMYRIALNVAISFYRKGKHAVHYVPFSETLIVLEEKADASAEMENNINLLQQFINQLNEIDKSIMLLYLDERSYKEIAEIMGIAESNVGVKINRAKEKLRHFFLNLKKE